MTEAQPGPRLPVAFGEEIWRDAVRGFSGRALEVARSARAQLEAGGIAFGELRPCEDAGPDGTELAGCAKLYLPPGQGPASERAFAFVLLLARSQSGELTWSFVAFGPRHPGSGVRSVYERAHRQLHGRFPR